MASFPKDRTREDMLHAVYISCPENLDKEGEEAAWQGIISTPDASVCAGSSQDARGESNRLRHGPQP